MTIDEGKFDQESVKFAQFLRRQPMPLYERADLVRHIAKLRAFRRSGVILEAAERWLEKEISDLEADLRKAGNAA